MSDYSGDHKHDDHPSRVINTSFSFRSSIHPLAHELQNPLHLPACPLCRLNISGFNENTNKKTLGHKAIPQCSTHPLQQAARYNPQLQTLHHSDFSSSFKLKPPSTHTCSIAISELSFSQPYLPPPPPPHLTCVCVCVCVCV